MPAQEDEVQRLRELHDAYAWEVNAAIGEGREDLVWRLVDDYLESAMLVMTEGYTAGCRRPGCTICTSARGTRRPPRHWWRRT